MMWWNDGMSWGGWIAMTLIMVVFWTVVVFGLIVIFRGDRSGSSSEKPARSDPMAILDERFARGDIDAEEYHARRDELQAPR